MKLQVLGTGCPKCNTLKEHAREALEQSGIDGEIEAVSQINDIMAMGVMMTPALAIEGEVKVSGRVPSVKEICAMLATYK